MYDLDYLLQTQLFPLVVLVIVFVSLSISKDHHVRESRSFRALILISASLLIAEILMYLTTYGSTQVHVFLHNLLNVYSFPAVAGTAFIWNIYLLREANYPFSEKKLIVALLMLPLVIEGIFALLSPFFGFFFDISATNVYARGFLFPLHSAISFGYLFIGLLIIFLQRKNLPQNEIIPMILFAIPPMIGGTFQMLFYGVLLINPALSLSVLMIFIFNQSRRVVTDYLTGLSNRRSYDKYLQSIRPKIAHQSLGGMLIDLDGFKAINDTYGHFFGDEVLVAISTISQSTFDANDFIAPTGGY